MEINRIKSDKQYREYLDRMNEIFHAEEGTPEGKELDHLADVIEKYEEKHYPMEI